MVDVHPQPMLSDGVVVLLSSTDVDGHGVAEFTVEQDGRPAGTVGVRSRGHVAELVWSLDSATDGSGSATRAVSLLVGYAFGQLGALRVEAYVDPGDVESLRVAARAGLRREGVLRLRGPTPSHRGDSVLLARIVDDPEPMSGSGFRGVLNAALPRKRAIGQLMLRDADDRVLLCQLTYKDDWDLPGGVSEVGESPAATASREVKEELALTIAAGRLLVIDWLPAWAGWDDALCLVFDGGRHPVDLPSRARLEPREIRRIEFCDRPQVEERCRDFTARRIAAAIPALSGRTAYLESGVECPGT